MILIGENILVSMNWLLLVKKVFGEGLLVMVEGDMYVFRKKFIIKVFIYEVMENYILFILDIICIYIDKWLLMKEIYGYNECKELVFVLVGKILMGLDFD